MIRNILKEEPRDSFSGQMCDVSGGVQGDCKAFRREGGGRSIPVRGKGIRDFRHLNLRCLWGSQEEVWSK